MTTFGEHLRSLRAARGLTQAELAERAGISERAVSDIERGLRRRVYPSTALQLAAALGLQGEDQAAFQARIRGTHAAGLTEVGDGTYRGWASMLRTPLIGREREVAAISAALADAHVRLQTLTGPGGIGKTRVAAEVCARLDAVTPGRVRFVSLAALREPGLVVPAIAGALGVVEAGADILDDLVRELRGRQAVLVLDTFEPVLDAAPVVGTLIDQTADLTVLITSRAPLRLRGEREMPLEPLPVPPAGEPSMGRYPAELLFVSRALAARPALVLDRATHQTIGEVCRRLGGVPLALELAAARVRHMSLQAVLAELDRPLRLLTDGERDLPERQQTMRATIEWSHDLLSDGERVVLRRLSAFADGWTLPAAEAVCGEEGGSGSETLEPLGRLVEHGLVDADRASATPRWRLLDPIRDFAAERLAKAGEESRVVRRHAEFYAALAEQAEPHIRGAEQAQWQLALRVEAGNLRTALSWAIDAGDAPTALRLGSALWMFWRLEGAFREGRSWLDRALAIGSAATSPYRPRALWGSAWLAYQQGDHDRAAALGRELEAIADRAGGSALDRRNALTILGHVATATGQAEDAVPVLREALRIARAAGADWHVAASLMNLGTALLHARELEPARVALDEAVEAYERIGDAHFAARALIERAYVALAAADLDGAAERFRAALRRVVELGERWGTAEAVYGLAAHAGASGDAERAAVLFGAAEAAFGVLAVRGLEPDLAIARPFLLNARQSLGDAAWRAGVTKGNAIDLDAAASLAADLNGVETARSRPGGRGRD